MYEKAKQFTLARPRLKKSVGWVCVVIGGVAFIMPLVPGFPLLIVGAELLGVRGRFTEKLFRRPAPVAIEVTEQSAAKV